VTAYGQVYDSRHLQADCLPRTGISSGTLRSVIEYGLPLPFLKLCITAATQRRRRQSSSVNSDSPVLLPLLLVLLLPHALCRTSAAASSCAASVCVCERNYTDTADRRRHRPP